MDPLDVAIIHHDEMRYSVHPPFHPGTRYPEYPFLVRDSENSVYEAVREAFHALNLDGERYGSPQWNPLGDIITPGNHVVIKPNFVRHYNPSGGLEEMITHGSVIRAALDYVWIALEGRGSVTIGDAPLQNADFEKIIAHAGIPQIVAWYKEQRNFDILVADFRTMRSYKGVVGSGNIVRHEKLSGDPLGYCAVNVGRESALAELSDEYWRFRVTQYDRTEMTRHHGKERHEYLVARSILDADVVVSIPKLKTHRKAGMTCALKNLIGINGSKDWLPHHRVGSLQEGGDEYVFPSARKNFVRTLVEYIDTVKNPVFLTLLGIFLRVVKKWSAWFVRYPDPFFEGSWYGNDTISRTTVDLNRILLYADKQGAMQDAPQRALFVVVDALVVGEKEGPVDPSPRHMGAIVAGRNATAVDLACTALMGFDFSRIRTLFHAMHPHRYPLFLAGGERGDFLMVNGKRSSLGEARVFLNHRVRPPDNWRGHIEYRP